MNFQDGDATQIQVFNQEGGRLRNLFGSICEFASPGPLWCCLCVAGMARYHLTPFEVGQVKAHLHHGLGAAAISQIEQNSSHASALPVLLAVNPLD